MITLYHYYLCSSSRYIRLILEEYKISYQTQLENYWKPQKDFLQLNPAGHLPVLINEENFPVIGANACVEYIRDFQSRPNLFVADYKEKAEINRLIHWFDVIFKKEVFDPIIYEKVFSRIIDNITPNSENIRAALNNLDFHIQYFNYLLNNKNYFIKDELTYLDFLAAANFSVLDYLGLLNLKSYENIREWYFKVKSRPSFKTLLKDQMVGLNPHKNYQKIDI